jgi:hypothetical protein
MGREKVRGIRMSDMLWHAIQLAAEIDGDARMEKPNVSAFVREAVLLKIRSDPKYAPVVEFLEKAKEMLQ